MTTDLHVDLCERIIQGGSDFNFDDYCDNVVNMMATSIPDDKREVLQRHIETYAQTRSHCKTTISVLMSHIPDIFRVLQCTLITVWLVNCNLDMLNLDVFTSFAPR